MPFSKTTNKHTKEYWTNHFEKFLKPIIEENPSLEARRSKALRGDIIREIIANIILAPIVVADLTDHNPNVYWELGVRQSFKHGTITIAEEDTKLPFDIAGKGILFYSEDRIKNENFRTDFKEAVQDCLKFPDKSDSHVLETIYGRGTLFEIFRRDETIRRLTAVISECNTNMNFLNDTGMQAQANQELISKSQINREKYNRRQYITSRCRSSAIELLITDRYVDADERFYHSAEEIFLDAISINDQLNLWGLSPDSVEKWLLGYLRTALKKLNEFKNEIISIRRNLIKYF